ncbi:hypothetical protein NDA13_002984 [Ustilago tritici]|nr:hypothetical protein NDA13_002984 [Ustilago tritici]
MSSSPPSNPPSSSSSKAQLSGLKKQWSQLDKLLPLSLDDNRIVSTSLPLALELKQVADPTTPVKPTSALPQQALKNTPRTVKATNLLAMLRGIEGWDFLIDIHKMACNLYSKYKSWNPGLLSSMVDLLIEHKSQFCAVIPELNNVFSTKIDLVGPLATIYNNLTSRFPTFNSTDQALAVGFIDPTMVTHPIASSPVSHLNDVYDKLGVNEPKPYFRRTPIVQLSGTGKTRMVYECQQRTPLLYVCFRKSNANGNTMAGYPLPDQGVQSYFTKEQGDYSNFCDLQVACFLPSESMETPSYKTIFDMALRQPLLDLNKQLTAVSRHLHSGQTGVPVPPVLVVFDKCIEMIVTTANNQLNSLCCAWNYIGTLQAKYETLSFWLVLMSTSSSAAYLVEHGNFWDNVLVKLQGSEAFSADNTVQCFSVMASRLALGLVLVHEGGGALFGEQKLFMDKAVDRHMRMVSRISNDATMYVNSPSEPVLAIAALLIMLCTATKKLEPKAVDMYGSIMGNFQGRCLVDSAIAGFKGMHGKLASRMALIVAWDTAKRKELDALKQQTTLNHVKVLTCTVPLETILSELADLDEANADQLCQRVERVQQDGSPTRSALQRPRAGTSAASSTMAWTNFKHFDVLPKHITEISPKYLWYCWKRGVGLQMAHSQHGIDGILPVFMGNLDRPFVTPTGTQDDAATSIEMHATCYMTYVAWEAKNRDELQPGARSGKPDVMLKLTGPSIMHASHALPGEEPLTERALLCVLLDLGTSTPFASKPQGFRPRVQTINGTECPRLCIRGVTNEHAYPCLDVLKIQAIFEQILTALAEIPMFEQFNVVSNPIWNHRVQPALPSISATGASNPPAAAAAAATDDDNGAPQRKKQHMDLD